MLTKKEADLPEKVEEALLALAGTVGRTLIFYAERVVTESGGIPRSVYFNETVITLYLRSAYRRGYDGNYDIDIGMREDAEIAAEYMRENGMVSIENMEGKNYPDLPVDPIAIYGGLLAAYERGKRDAETTVNVNEETICTRS